MDAHSPPPHARSNLCIVFDVARRMNWHRNRSRARPVKSWRISATTRQQDDANLCSTTVRRSTALWDSRVGLTPRKKFAASKTKFSWGQIEREIVASRLDQAARGRE